MKKASPLKNIACAALAALAAAAIAAAQTPDTRWYVNNSGKTNFTISTADELAGLAQIVNGTWGGEPERDDFAGKTVMLAKDIDLSDYGINNSFNDGMGWIPIGRAWIPNPTYLFWIQVESVYNGIFDGNGKTVSGLYINTTSSVVGLFGRIGADGAVKNISIMDVEVTGGEEDIGSVAGYVVGSVTDCYATGRVRGSTYRVGGVAGSTDDGGSVSNSCFIGTVRGSRPVGGVVGTGNAANCYFVGTVFGDFAVGGVVGGGSAANCYAVGTVNGGNDQVGGVAGMSVGVAATTNSAALNLIVTNNALPPGRVLGTGQLKNSVAFSEMMLRSYDKEIAIIENNTLDGRDGADITAAEILADGTLGGRFTAANGWTVENGKLPGFGAAVVPPAYLTDPEAAYVSEVHVSPNSADVVIGRTMMFTASVSGIRNPAQAVTWSVSGGSAATTISADGVLSVAADEKSERLAVRAVATADPAKWDVALVKVTNNFFSGSGTAVAPYIIEEPWQLALLAEKVNEGDSTVFGDKHYKLGNDIDLSAYGKGAEFNNGKGWIPIGAYNAFRGAFDGGGHTISGLYINDGELDNAGLFGSAGYFRLMGVYGIRRVFVPLKGVVIRDANITAKNYVGGLVGDIFGRVERCHITGTVSGINNVGGVVGRIWGYYPTVESQNYAGVEYCYSTATVSGTEFVGGVVGDANGSGYPIGNNISNCYSTGAVNGSDNVGGLVGRAVNGKLTFCYSASAVSGAKASESVGGLAGSADEGASSTSSYWDIEASGQQSSALGDGKSTAEMKTRATYIDWDFDRIWGIDDGTGYPYLQPNLFVFIAATDRVIRQDNVTGETAVVPPVNKFTAEFTAGPNPVARSAGVVTFFWQGKALSKGSLKVFDASGNVVKTVSINDKAASGSARREVGAWNLGDSRGRAAAEGAYAVKGVLVVRDGSKVKVSSVVSVQ